MGSRNAWPALPTDLVIEVDSDTRLRPWETADAGALADAWADPTLSQWLDPPQPDIETARRWIEGSRRRCADGMALDLVIERGGAVAGEVGLSSFEPVRHACLVGYWVAANHRGSGLAAVAVRHVVATARDELDVRVLVAECHPANVASHRTAERAGFALLAEVHNGARVYALR